MPKDTLTTLENADRRTRELGRSMFNLNASGTCTDVLLMAEGFSRHELDTLGPAARQVANELYIRRDDAIAARAEQPLAEKMAKVIIRQVGAEETAVAALQKAGFPGPEIAAHIDEANRLAGRFLVRDHLSHARLVDVAYALGGLIHAGKLAAGA